MAAVTSAATQTQRERLDLKLDPFNELAACACARKRTQELMKNGERSPQPPQTVHFADLPTQSSNLNSQ